MRTLYNLLSFYTNLILAKLVWGDGESTQTGEELGNKGASWWIPTSFLKKKALVYSGGVGEDISFDLALIAQYEATIFAFDPTPKSKSFIETQHIPKNFYFFPIGLWKSNKIMKFYVPKDTTAVSHSIVNLQKTENYFEAKCFTYGTIINALKHTYVDILKIDIEGAEYAVLCSVLCSKMLPGCICVEFDQPCSFFAMRTMIKKLENAGYRLEKRQYFNFTFLKK